MDRGKSILLETGCVCIPIIFNVEAVNSQKESSVRAARRGGVKPCNYSWKANRGKLPRDSWERALASACGPNTGER
ncbi:hypothetical protein NQZ68_027910 [Dissostichus eleginoides]|nr:hypothetical protein NQZ68_027910 [Dissostichus eleginoides]